jgi:D-3-phosphoglycerate dehydrogenase / 2-oxoglutarate reductase
VIGVGNIGKAVIRRARAFGMKMLGTDIIPIAPDFILENGVEMTSLKDLMQRADFISCQLRPEPDQLSHHQCREPELVQAQRGD